jgi:hypothetical protein
MLHILVDMEKRLKRVEEAEGLRLPRPVPPFLCKWQRKLEKEIKNKS